MGTYIVYKHTLREDGRVYIGQTNGSLARRSRSDGSGYKHCPKFNNAIQKYGWEAFDHEIIVEGLSLEEANKLEDEMILQYNSIDNGFNVNRGGKNHIWTEEQRKIMSEQNLGVKNPNYGKPRSEETKRKISEANKISQLGKRHTEETKNKMSKIHQLYIPILCIETNIVYSCPSEAAKGIGKKSSAASHITEVCQYLRKTAYGYHWKYLDKDRKENNI